MAKPAGFVDVGLVVMRFKQVRRRSSCLAAKTRVPVCRSRYTAGTASMLIHRICELRTALHGAKDVDEALSANASHQVMSNPAQKTSGWSHLNHDKQKIRLLEVDVLTLRHHLKTISLRSEHLQYTALSYPWGSQLQESSIYIGDAAFEITHNLKRALQEVMAFLKHDCALTGRKMLLWCDQICIDQSDIDERNHQVAFMGRIYSQAEQVLVWLPIISELIAPWHSWEEFRDWHFNHMHGPDLHAEADTEFEDQNHHESAESMHGVDVWDSVIKIVSS